MLAAGQVALAACAASGTTARQQFVERLQQPGVHRFDQVSVGVDGRGLTEAEATCVADAFERSKWPVAAALDNRVPASVDVKVASKAAAACIGVTGTTVEPTPLGG